MPRINTAQFTANPMFIGSFSGEKNDLISSYDLFNDKDPVSFPNGRDNTRVEIKR